MWGFFSSEVEGSGRSLLLVCAHPTGLSRRPFAFWVFLLIIACSERYRSEFSGQLPLGRRAQPLLGHSRCATRCRWGPVSKCVNVLTIPLQDFLVTRATESSWFPNSSCCVWQCVCVHEVVFVYGKASSSWQEVVGVLKFGYSTIDAV